MFSFGRLQPHHAKHTVIILGLFWPNSRTTQNKPWAFLAHSGPTRQGGETRSTNSWPILAQQPHHTKHTVTILGLFRPNSRTKQQKP